jgi:serine protease Do
MNTSIKASSVATCLALLSLCCPLAAQSDTSVDPQIQQDLQVARSLSRAFNHVANTISPSVVHISQLGRPPRLWFAPQSNQLQRIGAGSGVIVSEDGYILTNHHVITQAEQVRVKLNDGREFDGRIIGTDPATDLGVLKINASGLTPARFGDSEALQIGEWVIAVGSPFGIFDNTVTSGIVSAKGRTNLASQSDEKFEDYIQTDAAINPGNSGGPLVNLDGRVVGINSQIASRTGGSVGIGFAIPSTIASAVMDSLIRNGRVERGWVGISMEGITLNPSQAAAGLDGPTRGVIIRQVTPGSPAEAAGLQEGDIVVRFNGRGIESDNRMRNLIAFTAPGTQVPLEVQRNGRSIRLNITISDMVEGRSMMPGGKALKPFGFTVQNASPQFVQRFGRAVGINFIEPLGPAAEAQLMVGDAIFMVDGTVVGSVEEFDRAVDASRRDTIRLSVQRGMQRGYVDVPRRD